jgi:hypothetical protein
MFNADRDFSVWLAENELDDIKKDERAALIGMAGNIERARRVLEETERTS